MLIAMNPSKATILPLQLLIEAEGGQQQPYKQKGARPTAPIPIEKRCMTTSRPRLFAGIGLVAGNQFGNLLFVSNRFFLQLFIQCVP